MPRHSPYDHAPAAAVPRRRRPGWSQVRRSLTAAVFLTATVAGVTVGLQGASVSPVAPPPAVLADAAPAVVEPAVPTDLDTDTPARATDVGGPVDGRRGDGGHRGRRGR